MKTYTQFLEELSEEELEAFEKDMKDGVIQRYILRKKEFFNVKSKRCSVCGNDVREDCYVLVFGDPSIRKKAHFCGKDCLEYFIHHNNNKLKKPELSPKADYNAA